MIKHIVLWKLRDEALGAGADDNAREIAARAESLQAIPSLLSLEVGVDVRADGAPWDVALFAEFATREDLASYQAHPAHKAFAEFVNQVRAERAVVDYEV